MSDLLLLTLDIDVQVMQRSSVLAAAACALLLAGLTAAEATDVDPFCPPGMQYLVGLKCKDGPVSLTCVPELLRRDLCELPDTGWGRRYCRHEIGVALRPDLIEEITGASLQPQIYVADTTLAVSVEQVLVIQHHHQLASALSQPRIPS